MYEAADLDGATMWQKIRYITLPCIRPTVVILFLLAIGTIMKGDFQMFWQVTFYVVFFAWKRPPFSLSAVSEQCVIRLYFLHNIIGDQHQDKGHA